MERRRAQLSTLDSTSYDSAALLQVNFDKEDFDDDGRKKPSNLFRFSAIGGIIIFLGLLFFAYRRSSNLHNPALAALSGETPQTFERIPDLQMPLKVPKQVMQETPAPTESKLQKMALLNKKCLELITDTRKLKATGVVMETDEKALQLTGMLQNELKKLLKMRFGDNPTILVEMKLTFPSTMPDFAAAGADGTLIIEMGPIDLVPYCVFNFLEIVRRWNNGAFHRNAGHVLQALARLKPPVSPNDKFDSGSLAFQEYNQGWPHKRYTLGYAGRPGGPEFYISTVDNTGNHGPGSQGSKTEADGCFGRIHDEASMRVVDRMMKQPGKGGSGFISSPENFIRITSVKLLSPDAGELIHTVDVYSDQTAKAQQQR
jgi:hypothetical protein